jgi:hypothetical protein
MRSGSGSGTLREPSDSDSESGNCQCTHNLKLERASPRAWDDSDPSWRDPTDPNAGKWRGQGGDSGLAGGVPSRPRDAKHASDTLNRDTEVRTGRKNMLAP